MAFHAPDLAHGKRGINARHIIAGLGQNHRDPRARIGRAADDLFHALVGFDHANAQPIRIGVLLGRLDARDGKGRKPRGAILHAFDLKAQIGQRLGDRVKRRLCFQMLFQPGEGEFHGFVPNVSTA